jgi:hypothetical protein
LILSVQLTIGECHPAVRTMHSRFDTVGVHAKIFSASGRIALAAEEALVGRDSHGEMNGAHRGRL